ncbi:MAG: lipopolysaccharide heptosyltransferase II [Acidobacteriota bacterium]
MKILVRGTNWIGDAVMTVPALTELRRAFPDAHITLHTRAAAAQVFEDADFVDEILIIGPENSKLGSILSQSRIVRRHRFGLGILLTNSVEAAAVQRLGSVPIRFGYATQSRSPLLTHAVPVPQWKDERHEVFYYLDLIESVKTWYGMITGPASGEPMPALKVSGPRRERAAALLRDHGINSGRPIVALGVGSTNSRAKRWPAERYAMLADRLAADLEADIVLVGSEGDKPVSEEVVGLATAQIVDLCGLTSVSEAAALLADVDLLISNDMGLAHLAPAIGTPTIVIFGPTNEVTTRPFSDNAEIIRKPVECSPCMLRDCPIDHRCMTHVSVEDVLARASHKLRSQ